MRRSLAATLTPLLGLALACGVDEPTGPAEAPTTGRQPDRPSADVIASIAVVDQLGNVGSYTSLASGSDGRQHVTYKDLTNQDLKYATCARSCTLSGSWTSVRVDQDGAVGSQSSLKVGANGRRHITYRDLSNKDLKYATCAPTANCTVANSWQKVRIDTLEDAGSGSAIALGPGGVRNVSYFRRRPGSSGDIFGVRYAACSSNCGQAASWTKATLEEFSNAPLWGDGLVTSIVIGSDGRRHISYVNPLTLDLKYATCLSGCTNAANWQKLTVDQLYMVGLHNSIAVGQDGVLHVSYQDYSNRDLKYARCAFDCTVAANWKNITVAKSSDVGSYTSIAVEANGRVHISATQATNSALYYATCNADCIGEGPWDRGEVDGAFSDVGWHTSLTAVGGSVRISYYDRGNGDLKFMTRTPLINPF